MFTKKLAKEIERNSSKDSGQHVFQIFEAWHLFWQGCAVKHGILIRTVSTASRKKVLCQHHKVFMMDNFVSY